MNSLKFKNSVFILVFLLVSVFSFSQTHSAIGVRGLYSLGGSVTYKTFVAQQGAVEVIGNFYRKREFDVTVTVLYEWHKELGTKGLYYYFGVGGHTSLNARDLAGVGVLGLDFRFSSIPLNLSLDWMPTLWRLRGNNSRFDGGGLAIRYMF